MFELIQKFFIGHVHQWETIETREKIRMNGRISGLSYICKCKHCGKIKSFNINA